MFLDPEEMRDVSGGLIMGLAVSFVLVVLKVVITSFSVFP
jgi:hypothetical protein